MGFGATKGGITSISQVEMRDGFFVGVTSPSGKEARCLRGIAYLFKKLKECKGKGDKIVTDSTGWVKGKKAKAYKLAKIEIIQPDLIVCFGDVPYYLKDYETISVESFVLKKRSKEVRSGIRRRIYGKWLQNCTTRRFKFEDVEFCNTTLFRGEVVEFLEGVLDCNVVFAERGYDFLNVCVEEEIDVSVELIKALVEIYEVRDVCIFTLDQLKGLLLGLYGDRYLGCGLLESIDLEKREIEVLTPVSGDVKRIDFGEIRLDENYRECVVRVP
jgi:polynucleotide 5'-hydroxyl-kinase GRC3/NOL9